MVVGFVLGGLGFFGGVVGLILAAIEKVSGGQGHDTYRTFWEVEFNYFGVLVLFACIALALVVGGLLHLWEYLRWRGVEKRRTRG